MHLGRERAWNLDPTPATEIQNHTHFVNRLLAGLGLGGVGVPIFPILTDRRVVVRGEGREAQPLVA